MSEIVRYHEIGLVNRLMFMIALNRDEDIAGCPFRQLPSANLISDTAFMASALHCLLISTAADETRKRTQYRCSKFLYRSISSSVVNFTDQKGALEIE